MGENLEFATFHPHLTKLDHIHQVLTNPYPNLKLNLNRDPDPDPNPYPRKEISKVRKSW